ncbi:MAG: hypothetical protein KAX49_18965, partial [Halanaerobiales bacterium]|nr:hypothetical protein [Halanaerobiales bacterium]
RHYSTRPLKYVDPSGNMAQISGGTSSNAVSDTSLLSFTFESNGGTMTETDSFTIGLYDKASSGVAAIVGTAAIGLASSSLGIGVIGGLAILASDISNDIPFSEGGIVNSVKWSACYKQGSVYTTIECEALDYISPMKSLYANRTYREIRAGAGTGRPAYQVWGETIRPTNISPWVRSMIF